jgi:hypothetical protein
MGVFNGVCIGGSPCSEPFSVAISQSPANTNPEGLVMSYNITGLFVLRDYGSFPYEAECCENLGLSASDDRGGTRWGTPSFLSRKGTYMVPTPIQSSPILKLHREGDL